VEDFLDNRYKADKQYTNKKIIPDGEPVKKTAGKRSRLSLAPKSPTIVEVISPISSPITNKTTEESRPGNNAFSRFKKMKSDFKEKKNKLVPLNVSTNSVHYPTTPVEKTKKVSPLGSKEMVIESASETKVPATANCAEDLVEETQNSPNLIENSLPPLENSPTVAQRIVQQQQLETPASVSTSVVSNSPLQPPCAPVLISPSTIRLLEKSHDADSSVSCTSRKRKTFSLESNTGDIVATQAFISPGRVSADVLPKRNLKFFFKSDIFGTFFVKNIYKIYLYDLNL